MAGNRVRTLRKEQGLSQTQLAERTGTSFGWVSMVEREATGASLHTATAIADALNTSLPYLLGQIDDRRPVGEIASELKAKTARIQELEENQAEAADPKWPEYLGIVRMTGEAMEPTIPDGSAILVDTAATDRRDGCIAVVRLGDRQLVKRLLDDANLGWLLASDNPDKTAWPTEPWPDGTTMIGEVKWLGRALV